MGAWIERQAVGAGQGRRSSAIFARGMGGIKRKGDVFRNSQALRTVREKLEHHADAKRAGVAQATLRLRLTDQTMSPALGCKTPNSILTSVDLPAPFFTQKA